MTNPGDEYRGLGTPAGPDLGWAAPPPPRPIVGQSPGPPTSPPPAPVQPPNWAAVSPARPQRRRAGIAGLLAAAVLAGGVSGAGVGFALDQGPVAGPTIVQERGTPAAAAMLPPAAPRPPPRASCPAWSRSGRGQGSGSGVVMDDQGHVLTNHHVVAGSSTVSLVLSTGRRVTADVIGSNRDNDIAVLQARSGDLPAARLGVSADLRIGQSVIAVGSPLGLTGTVTSGVISALDRRGTAESMIQTDASINPGNSGGPLVDLDGRVVGINTSIATLGGRGAGNIGIGFAVPIDRAAEVAQQILTRG